MRLVATAVQSSLNGAYIRVPTTGARVYVGRRQSRLVKAAQAHGHPDAGVVVVAAEAVSAVHCLFAYDVKQADFYVVDLGSTYGTEALANDNLRRLPPKQKYFLGRREIAGFMLADHAFLRVCKYSPAAGEAPFSRTRFPTGIGLDVDTVRVTIETGPSGVGASRTICVGQSVVIGRERVRGDGTGNGNGEGGSGKGAGERRLEMYDREKVVAPDHVRPFFFFFFFFFFF